MLVLTRKVGEKLKIGDDIVVSILDVTGGNVKVGISAPRSLPIFRLEVYERVQMENISASQKGPEDMTAVLNLWQEKKDRE